MQLPLVSLLLSQAAHHATGLLLPYLTGPYRVGTVGLELIDHKRVDNLAPTPRRRDLMVSLFYPTRDIESHNLAPDFPPQTAAVLNQHYGVPSGTLESIISQAYLNASLCDAEVPVLLFSPGFEALRLEYTALLEDIASLGYLVVAIDHPYDTAVVEYPDGRMVFKNSSLDLPNYPGGIVGALDVRVADLRFALNALSNSSVVKQIPGQGKGRGKHRLRTNRVCAFGHSFGGASSAQVMMNDTRFVCGVNMDGTLFGPVVDAGLDKPFMIMAAQNHTRDNDETWATTWSNSRGFQREININGTTHGSFTDYEAVLDELGPLAPPEFGPIFGAIKGARMLDIESAYLGAFFGKFLRGDQRAEKLLNGPSAKYPEVRFED